MKRFLLMVVFFSLATSLYAKDIKPGTFGLGWYSPSAPVGGRVWVNDMVGIDLGLGLATKEITGGNDTRFHVNVGVPVNVVTTENVNFFIRPGVEFQTNGRVVNGEVKSTMIITADLGVEWFVADQFSLSVGHGLQAEQVGGTEDKWGISALRALSVSNVGFHFYFK
jgi:hypothetical protein